MTRVLHKAGKWLLLGLAAVELAGCSSLRHPTRMVGARRQPTNVFRKGDLLPPDLRRIAVLPLTAPRDNVTYISGIENLQPVVFSELNKTKRFELVAVSSDQLRQWTDRAAWSSDDALPKDFFDRLMKNTGCDGVLFCQLTRYQPYPPMSLGWKLTLTAGHDGEIWWVANDVFEAGDPATANSAEDYAEIQLQGGPAGGDTEMILSSPTRFGQYSLSALFATLPTR